MVSQPEQQTQYGFPAEQAAPPQTPFPSSRLPEPPPPRKPWHKRRAVWVALACALLLLTGIVLAVALTRTPAQITYPTDKSAYQDTTVGSLDKLGNAGKGQFYHFTATILRFVKDGQGNTAGANVSGGLLDMSIVQVIFPSATDLTQLNTGDTIEVWGYDGGVFSGPNAFGVTVQEVGVLAVYLTDTTTGYSS